MSKPRIFLNRGVVWLGRWQCQSQSNSHWKIGVGNTPAEAYVDWNGDKQAVYVYGPEGRVNPVLLTKSNGLQ